MYSSTLTGFVYVVIVSVLANGAVLDRDDDGLGLYQSTDRVKILTHSNLNRLLYRQKHAMVVQFYNHFCGHCRAFSPTYKELAQHLSSWNNVFQLAVVDCANEVNVDVCRNFEIMMYPTLRYFHENYIPGNANLGDKINVTSVNTVSQATQGILEKMAAEQKAGRFQMVSYLDISPYNSYSEVLEHVPLNVLYTFVIFESRDSTLGQEIILSTNEYENIMVKRVLDASTLARSAGITSFPSLVAVRNTLEVTPLPTSVTTVQNYLQKINTFLRSMNLPIPAKHNDDDYSKQGDDSNHIGTHYTDEVYYSDLEKTIKLALHTEVPKYRNLSKAQIEALLNFIDILINVFPVAPGSNLQSYLIDLKNNLNRQSDWEGKDVYDLIKQLETSHEPVYVSNVKEYLACKGSAPQYRGYTCGLWTLFHTLTVRATQLPNNQGPQVLRAMYGYITNFFGCSNCVGHFTTMAAKNRLFEVKENDKAVLWLWISHNEVNLRLAGDYTEDPEYPKIQFPSANRCPECRQQQGAWNLPAVYEYLLRMYGATHIKGYQRAAARSSRSNIFSTMEIRMLSLLYILSFAILILVLKLFLTKRFYRRRNYKHDGWGKV